MNDNNNFEDIDDLTEETFEADGLTENENLTGESAETAPEETVIEGGIPDGQESPEAASEDFPAGNTEPVQPEIDSSAPAEGSFDTDQYDPNDAGELKEEDFLLPRSRRRKRSFDELDVDFVPDSDPDIDSDLDLDLDSDLNLDSDFSGSTDTPADAEEDVPKAPPVKKRRPPRRDPSENRKTGTKRRRPAPETDAADSETRKTSPGKRRSSAGTAKKKSTDGTRKDPEKKKAVSERERPPRRKQPVRDYDEPADELYDDFDEYREEYFDDEPLDGAAEESAEVRRPQPRQRTGNLKKTSGADDFREWLSDNLRYFMLGAIVLVIILAAVFIIRGCGKGKSSSDETVEPAESTTVVEDPGTQETVEQETIANPLVPAENGIVSLVNERFDALARGDIDAVRARQTDLSAVDEAKIASDSQLIESYTAKDVYTKNGRDDGTYVTYVSYDTKYIDYATSLPMLEELYIITTGDGGFLVNPDAQSDPDTVAYMDQLRQDSDAQQLVASVQSAHDAALAADPDLASFLSGMGEAAPVAVDGQVPGTESAESASVEDGPTMTVTTDVVNMRSLPGGDDSEVIDGIPYGTSVRILGTAGENGDWYEVEYNGQTGYVYGEYLG